MYYETFRLRSWFRQFAKSVAPFRGNRLRKQSGLEPAKYEQIRAKGLLLKSRPKEWWQYIDDAMELYISPEDKDSWFLTRPMREVLSFDEVIGISYHHAFH